eukprot:CAMPEP_0197630388 /NCGR_PEP_ID=MMETSP1338-20131121/7893_1 /TAXON_ID=43686 ORGANISM="Pelagodinium beii, Strain RCC1491" /NCGR_SAMPLE_ID=MMETSP1338 /ASSEMBLY_ACC=CAM_ASM_000754 /LENGTH=768 /DNA_ID=CAMNT_0043201599 /DNA_START=1 /DNA_END=2304 /DNA_ORIENTATION=+
MGCCKSSLDTDPEGEPPAKRRKQEEKATESDAALGGDAGPGASAVAPPAGFRVSQGGHLKGDDNELSMVRAGSEHASAELVRQVARPKQIELPERDLPMEDLSHEEQGSMETTAPLPESMPAGAILVLDGSMESMADVPEGMPAASIESMEGSIETTAALPEGLPAGPQLSSKPPKRKPIRGRADSAPPMKRVVSTSPKPVTEEKPQRPASKSELGEPWPVFLERAAATIADIGEGEAALFELFRTTPDLSLTYSAFARLYRLVVSKHSNGASLESLPPWSPAEEEQRPFQFPYEAMRVFLGGHKAKELWQKLDRRTGRPEYSRQPCRGRRCVIVGAGPCGLRAAIELRLLGARVTVLERRESFSRINQLHLWSWCGDELKALGARSLEPPGQGFGSNPDVLSIGIAELQTLLFKTALLLGVEVLMGVEFQSADYDGSFQSWSVQLARSSVAGARPAEAHVPDGQTDEAPTKEAFGFGPSPTAPSVLSDVAVLVGSDGLSCHVGQGLGVEVSEVGSLRSEDAIGLVFNFAPLPSSATEKKLRSFSMARQFFEDLFRELEEEAGVKLENIVYTKSPLTNYFVMTPTRKSLASCGVLKDVTKRPLLGKDNIDKAALDALVRRVVAFKFKKGKDDQPTLAEVAGDPGRLTYVDNGPQLFDFSKLRRASSGLRFVEPAAGAPVEDCLLLAVVGDALLEPFWPEGLGIVRGFFSALDASSAITAWASGSSREKVLADFAKAFTQLKTLGAGTRTSVLRAEEKHFGLHPSSRYK